MGQGNLVEGASTRLLGDKHDHPPYWPPLGHFLHLMGAFLSASPLCCLLAGEGAQCLLCHYGHEGQEDGDLSHGGLVDILSAKPLESPVHLQEALASMAAVADVVG